MSARFLGPRAFGPLQLLLALVCLGSLHLLGHMPGFFGRVFHDRVTSLGSFTGTALAASAVAMLPPTILIGACFPSAVRWLGDHAGPTRASGLLLAVATGRLAGIEAPKLTGRHAVTVIVAARGYPGTPASGGAIRAIEAAETVEGVTVFHAGTATGGGGLIAKGGRVLAVTAVAETFANARARAYRGVDAIDFADGFHRRDIGWRELERVS